MKRILNSKLVSRFAAGAICLGLAGVLFVWRPSNQVRAQENQKTPDKKDPPPAPANPVAAGPGTPPPSTAAAAPVAAIESAVTAVAAQRAAAAATGFPAPPPGAPPSPAPATFPATNATPAIAATTNAPSAAADGIDLSFQGANVDMVVQWLAQTTGKSVVKHPRVQCQLTIVSSKKVSQREAIGLVYNALSLEGFTAIETSKSILIVPEGQEPKLIPEMIDGSKSEIPAGRQRLIKVFPVKHMQPGEMRDKLRAVLSDKGSIDTDDRAAQIIVTDYNDNLRLLGELIKDLDVASVSDSTIEIFPLQHAEAEELGNLVTLILTAQAPPPSSSGGGSAVSSGGRRPNGGPPNMGGPMPMPMPEPSPAASGGGGSTSGAAVHIWPDKTSNRLIVAAAKSKMPEIQKLIDVLDTDKPRDVAIRVLPLKNVSAGDLVKDIGPLYQRLGGKSLKDLIEISANERSNSLLILSSETNFKAIQLVISGLDTADAMEKTVRTFLLKNADAQDVAKQLQDLYKENSSSSRYFYYGMNDNSKNTKKPSIVADRRRNTIVVQAPPAQMEVFEKMIKTLDEPVADDNLAPRIYPLKYVSATDIEDVLNELFLKKTPQRNYFYYYDEPEQETPDRDVGRLYGKVRITSEPYSNAIILTANSAENLAAVEEVLKKLDVPSQAGETTYRVQLRFAKAAVVANSLNILFAKNGSPAIRPPGQQQQPQNQQNQQQQPQQNQQNTPSQNGFGLGQEVKEDGYFPWLGGQPDNPRNSDGRSASRTVGDLVGRVRVVPDQRSNSLMLSANVHFFPEVLKLIEELDAPTPQVMIEARIVQVSSDFLKQMGVRWGPNGAAYSANDLDNGINPSVSTTYNTQFGGNTTAAATATAIATALRAGTLNTSLSMDFLIQFLRRTTDATVLAEPQINIADNEMGKLFVGSQVPYQTSSLTPAVGGTTQGFQYMQVGVILEVTPHINDAGEVVLRIHAESSTLESGQAVGADPVVDTSQFQTELVARNGQTLVLGGIIQKQLSNTNRKTPVLGSIPGLGWAFKKKDKTTQDVELLVFLRPKITRSAAEARELLEEADKKAPLVRPWRGDILPEVNDKKPAKTGAEQKN